MLSTFPLVYAMCTNTFKEDLVLDINSMHVGVGWVGVYAWGYR